MLQKNYSLQSIQELAREIASREWVTVIERPGSPVLDWDSNIPFVNKYFPRIINAPMLFTGFMFFKNKLMVDKKDYQKVSDFILHAYETDPNYLKNLAELAEEECDYMKAFSSKLKKDEPNMAMKAIDLYSRIIHHFRWVFNASEILEKRIREAMEKPIKNNFITKYNLELAVIRQEISMHRSLKKSFVKKDYSALQKYPSIRKMILRFLEKYSWIKVFHHQGNFLSLQDILNEISQTLEAMQVPERKINIMKDIKLLRYVIFLRTHVAESLNTYSTAMMKPALEQMALDLGLLYEEITFLTVNELKKLALTHRLPIAKRVLRDRVSRGYACILMNGKYYFITGNNLAKLYYFHDKAKTEKNELSLADVPSELRGQTANRGLVRGMVKVITNVNDFEKLNKGDVLVANATTPNYITIMTKAAAFLTDEGGITSHAAIVSRELGKPCITGLKNATKILKDGDYVEVDANNGIVKIVNQSKV